jgi:hypothetical protein
LYACRSYSRIAINNNVLSSNEKRFTAFLLFQYWLGFFVLTPKEIVELRESSILMRHIQTLTHIARGIEYGLHICRVVVSGEYRIYVTHKNEFDSYIFDPSHDKFCADACLKEAVIIEDLISSAKSDIDNNFLQMYGNSISR